MPAGLAGAPPSSVVPLYYFLYPSMNLDSTVVQVYLSFFLPDGGPHISLVRGGRSVKGTDAGAPWGSLLALVLLSWGSCGGD